jgi:hypothetical protein
MAIKFACPFCEVVVTAPDHAAGRQGRCPKCDSPFFVPRRPAAGGPPPGVVPAQQRNRGGSPPGWQSPYSP